MATQELDVVPRTARFLRKRSFCGLDWLRAKIIFYFYFFYQSNKFSLYRANPAAKVLTAMKKIMSLGKCHRLVEPECVLFMCVAAKWFDASMSMGFSCLAQDTLCMASWLFIDIAHHHFIFVWPSRIQFSYKLCSQLCINASSSFADCFFWEQICVLGFRRTGAQECYHWDGATNTPPEQRAHSRSFWAQWTS